MSLAEEVRRLRKLKGLSQTELAELIGTTQGAVTHLETGRQTSFTVSTLYKLCDALGVACDHFRPFLSEQVADLEPEPARPAGKRK